MISKTSQHVLDIISLFPLMTTVDVKKYSHLDMKNINYHVRILRRANLVYVAQWMQNSRNVPTMVLAVGNKLDAEKPPLKEQSIKKHEKKLKIHAKFTPRADEAAAWLMNPITPKNLDMNVR